MTAGAFKPTVFVNFDGVIHSYITPRQGAEIIPDPIVPGVKEELLKLQEAGYTIVVCSARAHCDEGTVAIREYLDRHEVPYDNVTADKPMAVAYIDDRAIRFDGDATGLAEKVKTFVPWNKKLRNNTQFRGGDSDGDTPAPEFAHGEIGG